MLAASIGGSFLSSVIGAGNRSVGAMGHNGRFDDFEATATTGSGGTGTVVTVHHSMAGQTLGSTIDGVFHATVTDHLGSGSLTRDEAGATAVQRYTPFGANRGGNPNSLPTDRTFTGQTDDPGTGLIDYNARAYDSLLGRFTMADTILPGGGQLLNRYSYVGNNPLRFIDPSGHEPCRGGERGCEVSAVQAARNLTNATAIEIKATVDHNASTIAGTTPWVKVASNTREARERMGSGDWVVMDCRDLTWDGERVSCFRLVNEVSPVICAGVFESVGVGGGFDVCASFKGISVTPFAMVGTGAGFGLEFGAEHDDPLIPGLGIQENVDIGDGALTPFDGPIDITLTNCVRADAGPFAATSCNGSDGSNSTTGTFGTEIGLGGGVSSGPTIALDFARLLESLGLSG